MNKTNSTNQTTTAPAGAGRHTHACDKCSLEYVHYHPFKKEEHAQFAFQCPNPACEWYFEKGNKARDVPARKEEKGNKPTPTTTTETYAQRSVRIAYNDGVLTCDNWRHFRMVPAGQFKKPVPILSKALLDLMPTGVEARCTCEKAACREAWTWNRAGCWEADWVQPGSYRKGWPGKASPVPRRVIPLDYTLSEVEFNYLHDKHPGWVFASVGSGGHDHPIAHACTILASYSLFHKLPKGKYLDINGNPTSCETFNSENNGRNVHAIVNIEGHQDVIRSRGKWGAIGPKDAPRYSVCGMRDIPEKLPQLVAAADGCTSVHTLYYYTHKEVNRLVRGTKSKMMYAMMHRFVGREGTLNNGEQKWRRFSDVDGVVWIEQTNVETGASYKHLCNEHWFANTSWSWRRADNPHSPDEYMEHMHAEDGLIWDINKLGPDTYSLRITSATELQVALDTTWVPSIRSEPPTLNSREYVAVTGCVKLQHGNSTVKVSVPKEYRDVFNELRMRMVGQERSGKKYKAHALFTSTKVTGVMKTLAIQPEPQVVYDLLYASFWVDATEDKTWIATTSTDIKAQALDTIISMCSAKTYGAMGLTVLKDVRQYM